MRSTAVVRRAASSPALEFVERVGYAARGALYGVMGLLALRIALSLGGGQATDLLGSLVFLITNPFGKVVLVAMIIGLAAYSVWGFVRAILDMGTSWWESSRPATWRWASTRWVAHAGCV